MQQRRVPSHGASCVLPETVGVPQINSSTEFSGDFEAGLKGFLAAFAAFFGLLQSDLSPGPQRIF